MKDRIVYEKYRPDDFEDYYNLVKSDRVMRYITGKGLPEAAARTTFDRFLKTNPLDSRLGYFKASDPQTGAHIGECKLVNYPKDESVFEIGYLLKEQLWSKGYGTLICEAMLSLASAVDPRKQVIGIIDPENTASRRLLEKFGFVSFFTGVEDGLPTEKLIRHP
ncbi:GNAT family N-acetyltransferase [Parapedobacter sp. 10938]|uniref:GNAT family N-acetyltransferase n=1 Tax=Parapedobacter flavus TaxID=3110225 RepID=UPI002DBCF87B|nr:GNAT family N-acetyltransferase [Parapedobacter sp. 10938]MEC3879988.1 GNAT family N-acetyltransferase [Parapedobacter sp. 10938]